MAHNSPDLPRYLEMVRVSGQAQADRDTPEDQRRALDLMRERFPGTLIERIEHIGSGAKGAHERPDIIRLQQLADARAFDEVRVRHLDRLTRHEDPLERAIVLAIVRRASAVIRDLSGSVLDPSTMAGELQWFFSTLSAADERRKIVERTKAGARRAAAEGRLAGGLPPFARMFDKKTGQWGVDERLARAYGKMFQMCLAGHSLRDIREAMDRDGITATRGGRLTLGSLSRLLRSPAAAGHFVQLGIPCEIPAIVDDETVRLASERLRDNSGLSGPPERVLALFRKIAWCGDCGSPLYVSKQGKMGYRYYTCSSSSGCGVAHRVSRVDEAVRAALHAFLRRPTALQGAAGIGFDERELIDAQEELGRTETALAALKRGAARIAAAIAEDLLPPDVATKQLRDSKRNRDAAEQEHVAALTRVRFAERRRDGTMAVEARLASIRAGLESATMEDWRALCLLVFPPGSVRIRPDGHIMLCGALPLNDEGEAALRRETLSSQNRDGSVTLYLDAFPIGTNKLQVREERERQPAAATPTNGFRRELGLGADLDEVHP